MTVGELRRARKKCDERIDAIKSEHRDGRPKEEINTEIDSLKSRIEELRIELRDAEDEPDLPADAQKRIEELREERRRITRVLGHQKDEGTRVVTL
jgi:chromosome segregation ATPase